MYWEERPSRRYVTDDGRTYELDYSDVWRLDRKAKACERAERALCPFVEVRPQSEETIQSKTPSLGVVKHGAGRGLKYVCTCDE